MSVLLALHLTCCAVIVFTAMCRFTKMNSGTRFFPRISIVAMGAFAGFGLSLPFLQEISIYKHLNGIPHLDMPQWVYTWQPDPFGAGLLISFACVQIATGGAWERGQPARFLKKHLRTDRRNRYSDYLETSK